MLKDLLKPEIKNFIQEKKWGALKEVLPNWPPAEVADLIKVLDRPDRVLLFRSLPRQFAAKVFAELEPMEQDVLLKDLTAQETARLLADLSPDDRTALFEELPSQVTRRLFELLTPEDLKEVKQLLGYPEESVGRLMTPDYVAVRPNWTVGKALEHIRKTGKNSETINRIYVTDEEGKLLDDVKLQEFILADPSTPVERLMNYSFVSISAFEDQEQAVKMIKKYNLSALPVVDSEGILLGIVTFDDLMDVADEEVTEDFQKIAAISGEKEHGDFFGNILKAPLSLLYRKRVGWLVFLVFMNIFSGGAAAIFEKTIARYIVLIFFLPLLIDSGGNAGSQAATLMVRALALGDVKLSDWVRLLGKEFAVAGLLGATMGAAVLILGIFRGGPEIAIIVALSMLLIVIVGSIIGMSLPFIFTRLGRDPATASGPLITSICDITGILIYFSIATWLLSS